MAQQRRVVDFEQGVAMVITDLHGEGAVYRRLRDTFLQLRDAGTVDRLVICGDIIHGYGTEDADASLDMLLDVMRLQQELGADTVILLMGNHEMPHIYSIPLSKGQHTFTPRFEKFLMEMDTDETSPYSRDDVIAFLKNLPFYVRTKAGVLLTHAGAFGVHSELEMANWLDFDHAALLNRIDNAIRNQFDLNSLRNNVVYARNVKYHLSLTDPDHPRYFDLLRITLLRETEPDWSLLWDGLFAGNEFDGGLAYYRQLASKFLSLLSGLSPYEQRVIVAGHISADDGYTELNSQHLRLASYAHAQPPESGRYLLLDCETPVQAVDELIPYLYRVFPD